MEITFISNKGLRLVFDLDVFKDEYGDLVGEEFSITKEGGQEENHTIISLTITEKSASPRE